VAPGAASGGTAPLGNEVLLHYDDSTGGNAGGFGDGLVRLGNPVGGRERIVPMEHPPGVDVQEREVADRRRQVREVLPVRRLEPGGDRTPESFAGIADLADEAVVIRDPLLDDLVADTHGVNRIDRRVQVRLLPGEELVVLPPELGHDMFEPALLGNLRGPLEPERHRVGHQPPEPRGVQAPELDRELLLRGGMRSREEVEWWPGAVVDPTSGGAQRFEHVHGDPRHTRSRPSAQRGAASLSNNH
jgi:hypothetical protein